MTFIFLFSRCLVWVLLILRSVPVFCGYDKVYMGHETKQGYGTCSLLNRKSNGGEISGLVRPYEKQLNCTVNIVAPTGTMININIKTIDFVTANPGGCYSVKLLLYDGNFFETSNIIPAFPDGLCNQSIPSQTVNTRSNTLSLRFEVVSTAVEVSFSAVYTSFTRFDDGSCVFCTDSNDMCIPDELMCDGLANCADSSDEIDCKTNDNEEDTKSNATWIIISVLIGLILFVSTIIVTVIVYRRHRQNKDEDMPTSTTTPHYDSAYGPSTSRHWLQPPPEPPNLAEVSTSNSPLPENEPSTSYGNCYSSVTPGPLPEQPPSYERSQEDAAAEEKRAL